MNTIENNVVLSTVQALIGTITPFVQAVAVAVEPDASRAHVLVAMSAPDKTTDDLLQELASDVALLMNDELEVDLQTWIGDDWVESWPGRNHRMVFASHRQ